MLCPCCAGRTLPSFHDANQSGSSHGDSRPLAPEQFEIHRTSEPYKPCIPGDDLSVSLPAFADLPAELIRDSLPNWIYYTRVQRHTIWVRLGRNQICSAYAERLLLENDNTLSRLYVVGNIMGNRRPHNPVTVQGS